VQDGWNRKGLVGEDGTKKQAFDVLRDAYHAWPALAPAAAAAR
jgi:beta-glucuronidase